MRRLAFALAALVSAAPLAADTLPGAAPFDAALSAKLRAAWQARKPGYRPRTRHIDNDGAPKYTNRLFLESSPYLRQHAHNPVSWYPWGDLAFDTARRLGRPVLLSIGYSTCHWCHVMEEESFEDEEIARVLNEGYVAIKVDREERPDVDAVYMTAVQALTGRGGWPATVWLTAEREPFFGGTYFPPRDGARGVRLGFLSLLRQMRQVHAEQGARVAATAAQLVAAIRDHLAPHERLLTRAKPAQDGAEPSGNSVQALNLLRLHELTDDDRYRRRAERTLAAFSGRLARRPDALSELLLAGDFHLDTPKQVVIVTPSAREQAEPLLAKLRAAFVPNRVLVVAAQGQDLAAQARLVPLLEGKLARGGKATAYVCERRVCERPTSDPEVFAAQLAKIEPLGKARAPEDKALAYLVQEVPGWRRKHACGSCHNNGDAARALFRARDLGYSVPEAAVANTIEWLRQPLEWERAAGEPGTSDIKLARVQFTVALLGAVESHAIEDRRLLLESVRKLASEQDADGAWRIAAQASLGSPVAYGPFVATWLAKRTLAAADAGGFANEIARADAWLIANPATNVMDAAAAELALADGRTDAAYVRRREALELLLGAQTSDGGWGPYPRSPPEAFDTALALLALAKAGGAAHREPIRKEMRVPGAHPARRRRLERDDPPLGLPELRSAHLDDRVGDAGPARDGRPAPLRTP